MVNPASSSYSDAVKSLSQSFTFAPIAFWMFGLPSRLLLTRLNQKVCVGPVHAVGGVAQERPDGAAHRQRVGVVLQRARGVGSLQPAAKAADSSGWRTC